MIRDAETAREELEQAQITLRDIATRRKQETQKLEDGWSKFEGMSVLQGKNR